jgi:ribosomal protein S18 acetylase RimI-like enzyme
MTEALPGQFSLIQVKTPEEIARWRPAFIGAYQTVFSGFPYFERFYPAEAEGIWRKITSTAHQITLLAVRGEDQVVGFGMGVPLASRPDVARELAGLLPARHTFYLAELGVLNEYRGHNLGRILVRERLKRIDPHRFTHVVLRVSASNSPVSEMYKAMGFQDIGVSMEVSSLRMDGRVKTDRRFFLSKVLSRVDLSEDGGR